MIIVAGQNKNGVVVQSVDRACEILECFTGLREELGIKEISEMMNLSKSTVYGLVNTLVQNNFLEQNIDNKRYKLGIKLFKLGMLTHRRMNLENEVKERAEFLSKKYSSTVHLAAIYHDMNIVYIYKKDSPDSVIIYSQLGKKAPSNSSGVGKAIAAFLDEKLQNEILEINDFEKLTKNTLTSNTDIKKEWNKVKKLGYAVDNEEVEMGLRCVAAPIFGVDKKPIAAISVSASISQITEDIIEDIAKDIKQIADEISFRQGIKF